MNILAIESSCDETAAALVKNGTDVLSACISSQIKIHKKYLGVVPELASRAHVQTINQVIEATLKKSSEKIDAIAVTVGPGLVGSLLVGRITAETLGWIYDVPVLGINHIEGHLLSPVLSSKGLRPPFIGLVVSGGHTEIILAKKWGEYYLLGRTRDDAAGEAFDKVSKMMGLGYPGGPVIDRMAKKGNKKNAPFPVPWLPGTWEFSFSGLKTAVLYSLRRKKKWSISEKQDICAGFQDSVVQVLVGKTIAAAKLLKQNKVVIGGGVAANSQLREEFKKQAKINDIQLILPSPSDCTDNAAMIGAAAFFKLKTHKPSELGSLKIQSSLHIPYLKTWK